LRSRELVKSEEGRASEILYRALSDAGPTPHASMDALVEAVRIAKTRWLAGAQGDRRHSVSVGYLTVDEKEITTRLALISNWQTIAQSTGPLVQTDDAAAADDRFFVTEIAATDPIVLVAGWASAVETRDAMRLTRFVRDKRKTAELAAATARVNVVAAQRKSAAEMISSGCTTVRFLLGRRQISQAALGHAGDREHRVTPVMAQPGVDLMESIRRGAEETWAAEGLPGRPQIDPSTSSALFFTGSTPGSPYAHPDDPLFR
jgi:hypothetical protein